MIHLPLPWYDWKTIKKDVKSQIIRPSVSYFTTSLSTNATMGCWSGFRNVPLSKNNKKRQTIRVISSQTPTQVIFVTQFTCKVARQPHYWQFPQQSLCEAVRVQTLIQTYVTNLVLNTGIIESKEIYFLAKKLIWQVTVINFHRPEKDVRCSG